MSDWHTSSTIDNKNIKKYIIQYSRLLSLTFVQSGHLGKSVPAKSRPWPQGAENDTKKENQRGERNWEERVRKRGPSEKLQSNFHRKPRLLSNCHLIPMSKTPWENNNLETEVQEEEKKTHTRTKRKKEAYNAQRKRNSTTTQYLGI